MCFEVIAYYAYLCFTLYAYVSPCMLMLKPVCFHTGKWRECIFMQKLLAKGWGGILDNSPKPQRRIGVAARDRTNTAPAPTTRQKRTRPIVKNKTAAPRRERLKATTTPVPLEDFKFETPPQTPPPEQIKVDTEIKPDSEFWNFYDNNDNKKSE